jgi:hypothetical protein
MTFLFLVKFLCFCLFNFLGRRCAKNRRYNIENEIRLKVATENSCEYRTVKIEIWEIHDERDDSIRFLSELSFEAEEYEEAAISRKKMMDTLLNLGILLKVDSLKTQQMLDAYLVSP